MAQAAFAILLCVSVTACKENKVRSYSVPAEGSGPAAATQSPHSGTAAGVEAPQWKVPAGWTELPGNGMRFATLVMEPGDKPLEIRVTPLSHQARDPLENVNRWRGQIGLGPVTQADLGSIVKSITVDGQSAELVNMTGPGTGETPPQQVLGAILPGHNQVWFFLVMDDASRVSRHAADFDSFIRTVRLGSTSAAGEMSSPAGMPPGHEAMVSSAAGSDETMSWNLPSGWVQDANAGNMRVATIHLADPAGEVSVTKFPGDVGGLLPNINRWRKQIQLDPVSSPSDQPSEHIDVAGTKSMLFDLTGPGEGGTRERMLVAFIPRSGMSWFVKLTGPHALVEKNQKDFRSFVQTIRFAGEVR